MEVSDLLLFLLYTGYFTGPVQSLVNTSRLLQEVRTSFRRYRGGEDHSLRAASPVLRAHGGRCAPGRKGRAGYAH